MKFISILIVEGRKEDLKKKYSDKFVPNVLDWILSNEILEKFNHKYSDFVLKNISDDADVGLMLDYATELIEDFDKFQSSMTKKDINQYSTFEELSDALDPFLEKQKEKELKKQVKKIYEDDRFLVLIPLTEESSCKYGANTKWCVTSKGTGYYQSHTRGRQKLYFIIDKEKSKGSDYSKIAIHYNSDGYPTYFDSKNYIMNEREREILKYAFPQIISAIKKDFEENFITGVDEFLRNSFNEYKSKTLTYPKFYGTTNEIKIIVSGFGNEIDEPNLASGKLRIFLKDNLGGINYIDGYTMFVSYGNIDNRFYSINIDFMGDENENVDLNLEKKPLKLKSIISDTSEQLIDNLLSQIGYAVFFNIHDNDNLRKKLIGDKKVWLYNPDYGYKFRKNKGLINKLVNYLDSENRGTKLDFLENIGKLEKKIIDGIPHYKVTGDSGPWRSSKDMRGYFASFIASAKDAGIISFDKVGKKFILVKGPNFEDFKSGKLQAI